MVRTLFAAIGLVCLVGCGMNPGTVASAVPVQGRVVNGSGKPVGNVHLMLAPAGPGLQSAMLKVGPDGRFSGQAIAGNYLYYFEPLGKDQGIAAVPKSYRETHEGHKLKVGEGDVELRLTN